ncbi:SRPBCC family protein [Pseudomonas tohonis]|uniref:SRPBCC family protein n=1 Tax=Pseudomonas tohonis TaxID=2725477 RepID=UPI0021D8B4A6|nr:SRPBCC family protein [Pseudomonas tohonis]UXY50903.1 SRPBCC family protein [Pseudomonas tohonis]
MSSSASPTAHRECTTSRLIDAPPARVFRAIAGPEHLARWWGANGFSSTFELFEFRPDGHWRFTLHGPDGTDYPNHNVFREITPGRVLIEHLSDDNHHFVLTITLASEGKGTRVGWQQVFDTAEHREQIAAFVLPANEQNLDRLTAEVHRVDWPEA